mmetsp:Transcript_106661/g.244194  ORF Transcript_106661/g.244194 Transcript_106661/m.244194 type:complete len:696 (+) Transcript_106661:32-2119(+)
MADAETSQVDDGGGSPEAEDESGALPGWGTLEFGEGTAEHTVLRAVEEYLAFHGFSKALAALQEEAPALQAKAAAPSEAASAQSRLSNALTVGALEEFMMVWEAAIPRSVQEGRIGQIARLKAAGYFFLRREGLDSRAATELREAISGLQSGALGAETELVPLLALPFVSDPSRHPMTSALFADEFLASLVSDVTSVVGEHAKDLPTPFIYTLVAPPPDALHGTVRNFLPVAEALVEAASGQADSNLVEGAKAQLKEMRQDLQMERARSPQRPPPINVQGHNVDISKLSAFLFSEQINDTRLGDEGFSQLVLPVLLAILHKVCDPRYHIARRQNFLFALVLMDVFRLRSSDQQQSIILRMLRHHNRLVVEGSAALAALFACESPGRTYITDAIPLLDELIALLKRAPLGSMLHTQALACLQRVSTRRAAQKRMISLDVIHWIVEVLFSDVAALSDFSLEFGAALWMNLAMFDDGQRKCEQVQSIKVLAALICHDNPTVRTHAMGTLWSLMIRPKARTQAASISLNDALTKLLDEYGTKDRLLVKQIDCVIEQMAAPAQEGQEEFDEGEDDDEGFLEEEQLAQVFIKGAPDVDPDKVLRQFGATPAIAAKQNDVVTNVLQALHRQLQYAGLRRRTASTRGISAPYSRGMNTYRPLTGVSPMHRGSPVRWSPMHPGSPNRGPMPWSPSVPEFPSGSD